MGQDGRAGSYARRGARRAKQTINRTAARVARSTRLGTYIVIDYEPSSASVPRRRTSGPLHDIIAGAEDSYREALEMIATYEEDLAVIPIHSDDPTAPIWVNGFLAGLDGASIYSYLRSRDPALYLEVGSGTSTRFARRAISDGSLKTQIVSIDPSPRAEIDAICDETVRAPLELADPSVFGRLGPGDVVFFDGSHRVFTESDATVFFSDLLPTFPAGVLVGVHDTYLPDDYPSDIWDRYYSEQYLLGALLLGRPDWLRITLAADYVSKRPELAAGLDPLWGRLPGILTHGCAFWLETVAPGVSGGNG